MGWWKIRSVEDPGIDFISVMKDIDDPDKLIIGDSVCDIMADAIIKIGREYRKNLKRDPKKREIFACLNFIMPRVFVD